MPHAGLRLEVDHIEEIRDPRAGSVDKKVYGLSCEVEGPTRSELARGQPSSALLTRILEKAC
jgi:hypothetical protein